MSRIILIVILSLLAGCAMTTAVLLPDENGKTGALVLKQDNRETVVDQPYTVAMAGTGDVVVNKLSKEQVEQRYGESLAAEPMPPASFTLYFQGGGTELTEESTALLPAVVEAFKARTPAKVFIIGHTDRAGSAELNWRLALDRATMVEQRLRATSTEFGSIKVRSFGENDPLVPTADGVSEPRNRRVEILIL